MNIIIGTWIEVTAESITRKYSVPRCSNDPNHSSSFYFGHGSYCPTCGNKIVRVEAEEKGLASDVRDIVPNYSGNLEILDSKINLFGKTNTYAICDRNSDSTLYARVLPESDCTGSYYMDEAMWKSEQIEETRDEFLRLHSSFLVSLDNLKIQYELITGVGIFDW